MLRLVLLLLLIPSATALSWDDPRGDIEALRGGGSTMPCAPAADMVSVHVAAEGRLIIEIEMADLDALRFAKVQSDGTCSLINVGFTHTIDGVDTAHRVTLRFHDLPVAQGWSAYHYQHGWAPVAMVDDRITLVLDATHAPLAPGSILHNFTFTSFSGISSGVFGSYHTLERDQTGACSQSECVIRIPAEASPSEPTTQEAPPAPGSEAQDEAPMQGTPPAEQAASSGPEHVAPGLWLPIVLVALVWLARR